MFTPCKMLWWLNGNNKRRSHKLTPHRKSLIIPLRGTVSTVFQCVLRYDTTQTVNNNNSQNNRRTSDRVQGREVTSYLH